MFAIIFIYLFFYYIDNYTILNIIKYIHIVVKDGKNTILILILIIIEINKQLYI